jgi:hypothetical protein
MPAEDDVKVREPGLIHDRDGPSEIGDVLPFCYPSDRGKAALEDVCHAGDAFGVPGLGVNRDELG